MKWIKRTYLQCIPLRFGVCLWFYWFFFFFLPNGVTTVTPFIERSEGWSLRSGRVLDQSQQECRFYSPKFTSAANFSAPAQEGNHFFLSGRSARKKIHNFHIKSSHLCRTSGHVWLSSSACDHCCAYQLIWIMTVSNSGYAIKLKKKTVKRQTDTKTQWNTLQVSLFYSLHLRKNKV